MSGTVREIMNHEVFAVLSKERVDVTLNSILSLGITGCPVVDASRRPLGMVSWRDLVQVPPGDTVGTHMTAPVVAIEDTRTVRDAAEKLAGHNLHRLVVVDRDGETVGVVSAVDVIRGLLGLPLRHPAAFPHFDQEDGVSWTDDLPLEIDSVDALPSGSGVLALVYGPPGQRDRVVWADCAEDLPKSLLDLLSDSHPRNPRLASWLGAKHVRLRAAHVPDPEQRSALCARLRTPHG